MVNEMKHEGKIRSYDSLRFKNKCKNAHFQLCKWPNLLMRHSDQSDTYITIHCFEITAIKLVKETDFH